MGQPLYIQIRTVKNQFLKTLVQLKFVVANVRAYIEKEQYPIMPEEAALKCIMLHRRREQMSEHYGETIKNVLRNM